MLYGVISPNLKTDSIRSLWFNESSCSQYYQQQYDTKNYCCT